MADPFRTRVAFLPASLLALALSPHLLSGHLAAQNATPAPAPQKLAADRADGAAQVTVEDCSKWLHTLASPEFGGRGTGQEGFQKAAEFVRDHFQALGLEPAGDEGSFFQKVPWGTSKVDLAKTSLTFTKGDRKVEIPGARLGGSVASSESIEGDVVLVRSVEGEAFDQADLEDKVVVAIVEPRQQFEAMRRMAGKKAKALVLAQAEAIDRPIQGRTGGRGSRAQRGMRNLPATVSFGGADLDALLALAGAEQDATVVASGAKASLSVQVDQIDAPAYNVCAILRGRDPQQKDEFVVIGSHLDHLGRRGDRFWPGADDDGSGTTGVLAVATMFAKNKVRPARSILFLCFCGEENGLVGSRFYAENPTVPLSAMVAELQMDMIGRNEEENVEGNRGEKAEDNVNTLHLIGTQKLAPRLHEICLQKNETAGFEIEYDQEGMFSRSDHANFARMGVPIAFFFTGLHRDYHQTTDTPDKIDYPKLLRIAHYVYDIGFELAQMDGRPEIDPKLWSGYRGKGAQEPAAPMQSEKGEQNEKGTTGR